MVPIVYPFLIHIVKAAMRVTIFLVILFSSTVLLLTSIRELESHICKYEN